MKKLTHLEAAIAKLNKPIVADGETIDDGFNFILRLEDGIYYLFDKTEQYHYDYQEDLDYLMADFAAENDMEFEADGIDHIFEDLEKALKQDYGKDAYLDWYDNVSMMFEAR
jgi:hypothetical protein